VTTVLCLRQYFGRGGGPEQLIRSLAQHRDRRHYRFVVALWLNQTHGDAFRRQLKQASVEVACLHTHRMNPWVIVQLARLIRKYGVQILHTHDPYSDIFGLIAGKLTGCRTICSSHGFLKGSWKTRLYEAVDRAAMRGFDHVVAGSGAMVKTLTQAGLSSDKLSLVYNSIEIAADEDPVKSDFREAFAIAPGDYLVGVIGRLSAEKGHAVLLHAIERIGQRMSKARFVVVGDGPERSHLQVLTQRLGIEDKVLFTGYYEDRRAFLRCCDLFVLPSLRESLPMVLLEAMAERVAVVASDVGGVSELVSHEQTGLLVRPGDSNALANAVISLAGNQTQAKRMRDCARQHVLKHFNAINMVRTLEALYQQSLSAG